MDSLSKLVALSAPEKEARGLVHTPREIQQQPNTWLDTYKKIRALAPDIERFCRANEVFDPTRLPINILLVGAGTSDYIGKSVSSLLQKEWQCNVQAVPSTDLLTNISEHVIADRAQLWISFSRSGDSSEAVAALQMALDQFPAIAHLIVTCNEHGRMASSFLGKPNVFSIVLNDEVNDRGLAMTSSFSNMVIVAQALAHLRTPERYAPVLEALVESAKRILPTASTACEQIVGEGFSRICFLGSGPLKGAATESALKVLELSSGRVMSFAESFLGLRHGPLSAITPETLVVNFLSADERRRAYELDLIREICEKQLTAKCLSVYPGAIGREAPISSISLGFEHCVPDLYRPPVDVIIGQLLGLFVSLREGLKPDTPSPLGAISRVVSHVAIH
jgi:D-galactosamine 6-phosphate deaminase/isomerase